MPSQGSEPANSGQLPVVRNIFDVSAEFLGQYKTWLEQNPPSIPVTQIVGYQTNTVRVYKKSSTVLDVQNTAVETPIVDELVPSGQMGTTGIVRVTMIFDWLNSTGVGQSVAVKVKFGGTTLYSSGDVAPTLADRRAGRLEVEIANTGSASQQFLSGLWFVSNSTAPTLGIGSLSVSGDRATPFSSNGYGSADTTASQQIQVTVTNSAASASLSFRRQFYMVEFL